MMTDAKFTAWLLVALFALGCESKPANDKQQSPTTTEAKSSPSAAPGTPASPAPPAAAAPTEFASPSGFDLKPLAVGQWIRLMNKAEGSAPTQTFLRIVSKEGDSFWYEIETNSPAGTTIIQFLMDEGARKEFKKSSIKKLRVKTGQAPVQEYSGPMIAMVGSVVEDQLGFFGQPDLSKAKREDRAVKAGNFKGCYVQEIERNVLGVATNVKSYNHPAVPIVGFVRSEGTANGKAVSTELLEMHDDGARSSL